MTKSQHKTTHQPWPVLWQYAPLSNLVFIDEMRFTARSRNGGLVVYEVADRAGTPGRRPQCRPPGGKGPILAVGNHDGFLAHFILEPGEARVRRWDAQTFRIVTEAGGKISFAPLGNSASMLPLQYCIVTNYYRREYVTRDADGALATLAHDKQTGQNLITFGPFDVAAFGTFIDSALERRGVIVSREPEEWLMTLRGKDGPTLRLGRDPETARRAFLGFGGHICHPYFGLVAMELGKNLWAVLCADGYQILVAPREMQVVGVTSHPQHATPGLVLLATDKRALVVQGVDWTHILPPASSEIESVTVSTFASHIAYKTIRNDICVYSLACESSVYDLKMEGVTYHENPQRHVRMKPSEPIKRWGDDYDRSEHLWFRKSRFVPVSNFAFVRRQMAVARAADGAVFSYFVTHNSRASGKRLNIQYVEGYVPRPKSCKPIVYQSHSPGTIAAVGQTKNAMFGVKFPKRKNVVVLVTIGKGGSKYPIGEYPIENYDMRDLEWDDTVESVLYPCCIKGLNEKFELVTVHPLGILVRLTYDGTRRLARFGPEHVVAFELFEADKVPHDGCYVVREPTRWIVRSTHKTEKTYEIECTEDAPHTAFIGFPKSRHDYPLGQVAVPINQTQWTLTGRHANITYDVSPDRCVIGVMHNETNAALVVLESDLRTITVIDDKNERHLSPVTSDIVHVKMDAFYDDIVCVTESGEVVLPYTSSILLSPKSDTAP